MTMQQPLKYSEFLKLNKDDATTWIVARPEHERLLWLDLYNEMRMRDDRLKPTDAILDRDLRKALTNSLREIQTSASRLADYVYGREEPWNQEQYRARFSEAVPKWHSDHASIDIEIREAFLWRAFRRA